MARAAPSAQRPAPMGIVSYRRCLLYLEIPNLQLGETAASWERRGRKCGAVRGAVQATAVVACRGRVKTKIMQLPTVSYLHEVKVLCKAQALSPRPTPYHSSATGDNSRISTKRKNNGSTSPDALLDRPTKTPNGRGILRTIYDPKQLISSSLPPSHHVRIRRLRLRRRRRRRRDELSHEEMNASDDDDGGSSFGGSESDEASASDYEEEDHRNDEDDEENCHHNAVGGAKKAAKGGKSSAAGGAAETKKKKKKPAAVAPAAVAAIATAVANGRISSEKGRDEEEEEKTIEETYQKKTHLEHILLRPDT